MSALRQGWAVSPRYCCSAIPGTPGLRLRLWSRRCGLCVGVRNSRISLRRCCAHASFPLLPQLYEVSADTKFVKPSDAACDVACFIYDLSDPKSFSYCASIYKVAGSRGGGTLGDFSLCVAAAHLPGDRWLTPCCHFSVSAATLHGQPDSLRLRGLQDRPAGSEPAAARALPRRILLQALPPAALPLLLPRPGAARHHRLHQAGHRRHLPVSILPVERALGQERSLGRGAASESCLRRVAFGSVSL